VAEQTHYPAADTRQSDPLASLWRFAEMVGGTVFAPSRTLREIGQREAIVPAIFLVVLVVGVGVSGQVAMLLAGLSGAAGAETAFLGDAEGALVAIQLTGILWNIVWGPVLWTLTAGGLYGAAYLLGGRGRFMGLWAASGFALTPQLLSAPLAPMLEAAGALGAGWQLFGLLLAVPVYLVTFVWTLALLGVAVAQTMNLSGGRAFGSIAILIGGLMLLGILLVCAFMAFIVGIIALAAS
jgi:hypothetical protein